MKKLFVTIICLFFVSVPSITYPEEDGWSFDSLDIKPGESYLERDRFGSERVNIKSETHKTDGYIKHDKWESGRSNVYDKNGSQTDN